MQRRTDPLQRPLNMQYTPSLTLLPTSTNHSDSPISRELHRIMNSRDASKLFPRYGSTTHQKDLTNQGLLR
jgi:hypothetical protein